MSLTTADLIAMAEASLVAAKRALAEEMRAYPTPISGCDAQYNHLVVERNRVQAALTTLAGTPFVATPRTPFAGAGIESR